MHESTISNIAIQCASEALEEACSFSPMAARGTLRLALKEAGLSTETATPVEVDRVIHSTLPAMLRVRGVKDPEKVCQFLSKELKELRKLGFLRH